MKLKEFDFHLPDDRIARFPSQKRDQSRLMMVDRNTGRISHHLFKDIADLVEPEDFLVVNNSRVIPVKLFGTIKDKHVEMLLVNIDRTKNEAEAYALPGKKFKPPSNGDSAPSKRGTRVKLSDTLYAEVIGIGDRGKRILKFNAPIDEVLKLGFAPLPPYIKRKHTEAEEYREFDLERYQSVYAGTAGGDNPGSIAAPTAGLHFSPDLMADFKKKHPVMEITLNVGEATFQKIETEDISTHKMGREYITITTKTRDELATLKKSRKLIAVGTTSVRSLETYAHEEPEEESFASEIFISPGFRFKMVDRLITNFHLPQSSLFILTAAFGGLELIREAYKIAVDEGYRFFSYGDAMFVK
ncbi:MAG: tRNA preQ1(34) S-adenosylmethionine ribosyltransferase-isomerase QueA [bacterium]|nr:tRNA preQ1(34) S-adenosylmethionine ribosyltransferase-isomerase QueA [bacterium]